MVLVRAKSNLMFSTGQRDERETKERRKTRQNKDHEWEEEGTGILILLI